MQLSNNLFFVSFKAVGCVVELAFKVASGELKVGSAAQYSHITHSDSSNIIQYERYVKGNLHSDNKLTIKCWK